MIELTPDEAETVHTFLCEFRLKYEWEQKNLSYDKSIAKEVEELSDCIGRMEAKLEIGTQSPGVPHDTSGIPARARLQCLRDLPSAPSTQKFKAGDLIRHKPTGQKWTVAKVVRNKVYFGSCVVHWAKTHFRMSDCELVKRKEERENANTT